jgi:hypothetical protein
MWKSKKFIFIAILVVLVVGGTLGGVAIAQADDQSSSANQTAASTFLDKVAEIYDKTITQDQADAFTAWLSKRPAFPTDQFKQWMESRPDIPGLFGNGDGQRIRPFGGMRGPGKFGEGFRGMFGGRLGGGWCAPDTNAD